jgi:hypothetical protein
MDFSGTEMLEIGSHIGKQPLAQEVLRLNDKNKMKRTHHRAHPDQSRKYQSIPHLPSLFMLLTAH